MSKQLTGTRYTHDCDRCIFLGQSDQFDLWLCPNKDMSDSVLMRYSSDGPDYISHHTPEAYAGADEFLDGFERRAKGIFSDHELSFFQPACLAMKDRAKAYLKLMREATQRGLYTGRYAERFK